MSEVELYSKFSLIKRFTATVVVVLAVAMVGSVVASMYAKYDDTMSAVLAEARTLNVQMDACWDYISDIQDRVNYDAEGNYEFKGVYCATAAAQIAESFTSRSQGYVIRFVRWNPRNVADRPDDYELQALAAFGQGGTEYYGVQVIDGHPVFRFVTVLYIEEGCLVCHGDPAGSIDPSGGFREGMKVGDVAGATSIMIPLDAYARQAVEGALGMVALFALLLLVMVAVLAWALRRWVMKPMSDANEQLDRENKDKDEFLATMSHELRTPLSSIIAYTDVWKSSADHSEALQNTMVDEIAKNSHVLLTMVNNVIDSAKVNAGKYELELEDVDVYDLVGVVTDLVHPLAVERGLTLQTDLAPDVPLVRADWEALRKILTNLTANAIKFSDEDGTVLVRAFTKPADGVVCVSVTDEGCGIAAEDLEDIFLKFEQSESSAHGKGGSGLGLYLSRQLARMMDGDVHVESTPGKGSTFWVELPLGADGGKEGAQ